ncbi:short-chain dehydrogenase [Saitoella complicata NRRL Y-17804]|nr:short-chain dehydrogenase [Saitoella complicata NRRL Y-17804]ODQ52954.1 short-chain dehydrogenase [Saitoella complicata NRRL Y-17804]
MSSEQDKNHSKETYDLDALFGVHDLTAVITGGGTGIGLMCTLALAHNGARVFIMSHKEDDVKKAADEWNPKVKGEIIPIVCDVSDKKSLEEAVKEVEKTSPYIDLLVNNAGITGPEANLETSKDHAPHKADANNVEEMQKHLWEKEEPKGWHMTFQINTIGVYFTTVAFLRLLAKGKKNSSNSNDHTGTGRKGSVINISSMSAITKKAQDHFAYNASKAATLHLTKMMAQEFSGLGIRINTIAPGVVPTEMSEATEDEVEEMKLPAGRLADERDMAGALLYLVGRAGEYINGQAIVVDGGFLLTNP